MSLPEAKLMIRDILVCVHQGKEAVHENFFEYFGNNRKEVDWSIGSEFVRGFSGF
jgi:hypothetical protein